jgi:hypothetical protein
MSLLLYGLAKSLAYPSGEEGSNFLVQMSYLSSLHVEEVGRESAPCDQNMASVLSANNPSKKAGT